MNWDAQKIENILILLILLSNKVKIMLVLDDTTLSGSSGVTPKRVDPKLSTLSFFFMKG